MMQNRKAWAAALLAAITICFSMTGCKDDSSQQHARPEISLTDEQKQQMEEEAQALVDKILGKESNDSGTDSEAAGD